MAGRALHCRRSTGSTLLSPCHCCALIQPDVSAHRGIPECAQTWKFIIIYLQATECLLTFLSCWAELEAPALTVSCTSKECQKRCCSGLNPGSTRLMWPREVCLLQLIGAVRGSSVGMVGSGSSLYRGAGRAPGQAAPLMISSSSLPRFKVLYLPLHPPNPGSATSISRSLHVPSISQLDILHNI